MTIFAVTAELVVAVELVVTTYQVVATTAADGGAPFVHGFRKVIPVKKSLETH